LNDEAISLPTRRSVLRGIGAVTCAGIAANAQAAAAPLEAKPSASFFPILRQPDVVWAYSDEPGSIPLRRSGSAWTQESLSLTCKESSDSLQLTLSAPSTALSRLQLRWNFAVRADLRLLGDAWERSYGELSWQSIIPERAMPWYFLAFDGNVTHGYGVKTGAAAFAFWQCDREGVSLWLDARNGGRGVLLGQRSLELATMLTRSGQPDEDPFASARAFCRVLSPTPRLPKTPVYGSNDWYYAYGKSSAEDILRDADLMAELAPSTGPRPFTVMDEGWEHNPRFPQMAEMAAQIRRKGVRPGIWVRPLRARGETNQSLLLPAERFGARTERHAGNLAYDPTIPEARDKALASIRNPVAWKYDLVKHDFSTFDLLGQWGFEMGASPALAGWSFHDRSLTNAEIVRGLYQEIRQAAGEETILVGCNVVGHLSAGLFELQRTGDDVSGKLWERTRRMGVNTLAFRLPQHNAFFVMDPDCVPITDAIPWSLTRQWLDAVAASGASLVISPSPGILGADRRDAVRAAISIAASQGVKAHPRDWLDSRTPQTWQAGTGQDRSYEWLEEGGAYPFEV
jgi:alpha-galactosidase